MKKIAEGARYAGWFLLAGFLVVAGMRAGEWVIPAPESRVVLCFANELDQVEICQPLAKMLKQASKVAE